MRSSSRSLTRTFLFSDLRGYTAFVERVGDASAKRLLQTYRVFVRRIVAREKGVEVKTEGDSFYVVFRSSASAVRCAMAIQHTAARRHNEALEIGIGIHAGEALPFDRQYVGGAVNIAARLAAAAKPGEILLSETVRGLIRTAVRTPLEDRGLLAFKGVSEPIRTYAIRVAPPQPPPPAAPPRPEPWRGIPPRPNPLIGRESAVHAIRELLLQSDARLVTLTGPPGVGKTRLALEIAARIAPEFVDGAAFIDLSPTSDPSLVPHLVAQTIGLEEAQELGGGGARPAAERLVAHLRGQHVLLVLDNFEHVVDAASLVSDLLSATTRAKILVTSRAPLHLRWEHEHPVPPLDYPDPKRLPPRHVLADYAAVALLVERARAVQPNFALTEQNARTIAEICSHLEGLPLALELAAARFRAISPQALLHELQNRLDTLVARGPDVPERHRSLRAAVAWSYELLASDEQALFRRLAVFAGGFTPEGAGSIWPEAEHPSALLERLVSLVDKGLLLPDHSPSGEVRFRLPLALREFGREQLAGCGELPSTRQRHARFFRSLMERAEPAVRGPDQVAWFDRLEREYPDLRFALEWLLEQDDPTSTLEFAAALSAFSMVRGYHAEAQQWLERALAAHPRAPAGARAKALLALASLVAFEDDESAERFREEAVVLCRQTADHANLARALFHLATSKWGRGNRDATTALLDEAELLFGRLDDALGVADCRRLHVMLRAAEGDKEGAETLAVETLALYRRVGDLRGAAALLNDLGAYARARRDYDRARAYLEEALSMRRQLAERTGVVRTLAYLAETAHEQGNIEEAASRFEEALRWAQEIGSPHAIASCMVGVAALALMQGDVERAERLFQESLALSRRTGYRRRIAYALHGLGLISLRRRQLEEAAAGLTEALGIYQRSEHAPPMASADLARVLRDLGTVAEARGRDAEAAERYAESLAEAASAGLYAEGYSGIAKLRDLSMKLGRFGEAAILNGALEHLRRTLRLPSSGQDQLVAHLRRALGEGAFRQAVARTHGMPPGQIVAAAMQVARGLQEPKEQEPRDNQLTRREREVASLVVEGLSNRQIAERLFLSGRTVGNHIQHILNKLGFTTRAQIAAWAAVRGGQRPVDDQPPERPTG